MASVASRVRERQGERGRLPRMPRMGSTIGRLRHGVLMSVLSVASRLPLPLAYAAARRVGRLRHRALRGRLEMSAQAGRALGATPGQIDGWARRACELSASDTMEAHLLARLGAEPIDRLIRLEGVEQLEAGLA